MKNLWFAAIGGSMLISVSTVSAQGLPPGTVPPQYGSQAWSAKPQTSRDETIRSLAAEQAAVPKPRVGNLPQRNAQAGG